MFPSIYTYRNNIVIISYSAHTEVSVYLVRLLDLGCLSSRSVFPGVRALYGGLLVFPIASKPQRIVEVL